MIFIHLTLKCQYALLWNHYQTEYQKEYIHNMILHKIVSKNPDSVLHIFHNISIIHIKCPPSSIKSLQNSINIISQSFYTFKKLSRNLARSLICIFCHIYAPLSSFLIAAFPITYTFFQHVFHAHHLTLFTMLEIPTHCLNLCYKI